jgi:CrcB protein
VEKALPHSGGSWPWATFAVNVAGAALLAWLTTRLDEILPPSRYARMLLGTGLCGALTTFSTFQIEVLRLAKDGYPATAAGYATASVTAGMAIAVAATVMARRRRYG